MEVMAAGGGDSGASPVAGPGFPVDQGEESCPCLIEGRRGFEVGLVVGPSFEMAEGGPGLEVLLSLGQGLELLERRHRVLVAVACPGASLCVHEAGGEQAGAVEVEEGSTSRAKALTSRSKILGMCW